MHLKVLRRELGRDGVTLESGCQILLDTRYITLTSDTGGNNWSLFDQGKITPHSGDIIQNLKKRYAGEGVVIFSRGGLI